MGYTITQIVALGALPVGFTILAYLVASALLFWPWLAAKLWGVAVGLLVAGIGYWLSQRFLKGGDRERQPREVSRFLIKLTSLHVVAALGVAGCYMLPGWIWQGHLSNAWLCYVSAALGGHLSYAVGLWILFPTKDPHLAGRRMSRSGATKAARCAVGKSCTMRCRSALKEQDEPPLFFAGHWLPFECIARGSWESWRERIPREKMVGPGLPRRPGC